MKKGEVRMMRRCMAALVVAAVVSMVWSTSFANSDREAPMLLTSPASVAMLEEGRAALLDFRIDEGERLLRRLAARTDGAPAAFYHLTSSALLRFLMSDDDVDYETFHVRADSTKQLLYGEPASAWRDYLLAEVEFQRSAALAKRDDYIRAAWAARAAYKGFERVVAEFPDFYEPYKGLGILHLAIASMPSSYRFILRILGYAGSIRRGLEELELARARSRYASDEAAAYLALSHSILYLSKDRGLHLVEEIYERDPDRVVTSYFYGYMLVAGRRTKEAVDVLSATKRRASDPSRAYIDYIDFFLAESLFREGRFAEAVPYYRTYIDEHPGKAGKAMAHLHLGLALELGGQRAKAVTYYEDVRAARSFDTDEAARRAAEGRLAAPLSPRDRTLLLGQCAYDSGREEEAIRLLKEVLSDAGATDDQRAEAGYRLGRAHDALERNAAALNAYRIGIRYGNASTGRWAPWGQFFIGKIHEREGRLDEARAAYKAAASYGGRHDYHRALEQAVRARIELLGR